MNKIVVWKIKSVFSSDLKGRKKAFAILGLIIMVIPAGAVLGMSFHSSSHNSGISKIDRTGMDNLLKSERHPYLSHKVIKYSNKIYGRNPGYTSFDELNTQYDNLSSVYNAGVSGYDGINGIETTGCYVGMIPVSYDGISDQIVVYNNSTSSYSNQTVTAYNFFNIFSGNGGFIAEGMSGLNNQIGYFYVNSQNIKQINFTGLNSSNINIVGTFGQNIFISYFPNETRNTSYILEANYNGTILKNITSNEAIPANFQAQSMVEVNDTYYIGGTSISNTSKTATLEYELVSLNLSTSSFKFLEEWGSISENLGQKNLSYLMLNLFDYSSRIYIETSRLESFYQNNQLFYAIYSLNSKVSQYSLQNGAFSTLNLNISNNSVFAGTSIVGDTAFIAQDNYGKNSSLNLPDDSFFLLDLENNSLSNVTDLFGDHYFFDSVTSLGERFIVTEYAQNMNTKTGYSLSTEFNPVTKNLEAPAFSPVLSRVLDSPTYWVSQSTAGYNGVMTVGGNGFIFYNSTGFYSPGSVSQSGFLLSAAWNGNEFMLVGQKYFSSGYPTAGVMAYIYYPQNNTIVDISSIFGTGLDLNATLFSVSNASGNFLIAGISNINSGNRPLLYIYNPVSETLTNLSDQLPSEISNVQMGETVSSGQYAYVSFVYNGSIFLGYYKGGTLFQVGPDVVNNISPFTPVSSWRSNYMVANGSNLFMFGYDPSYSQMISYAEYNASTNEFVKNGNQYVGTETDFSYAMNYLGNAILLGYYNSSGQGEYAIALALNSSDNTFSPNYMFISGLDNSIYSGSYYNGNVFITSGAFSSVYYGIWDVAFNSFQTSIYNITFLRGPTGNGLNRYDWSVSFTSKQNNLYYSNFTNSSKLSLSLQAGNYSYVISAEGVYNMKGTMEINSSKTINVDFPVFYDVKFNENNLLSGSIWQIYLYGKNISSITLNPQSDPSSSIALANGSYYYLPGFSYKGTNFGFNDKTFFNVSNSNLTVQVLFPDIYTTSIFAQNLPANTQWSLSLDFYSANYSLSYNNQSTSNYMIAYLPYGKYNANYNIFSYSGNEEVNVTSTSLTVYIKLPMFYALYVDASNLPNGDNGFRGWYLTYNYGTSGINNGSTGSPVYFVNGTYSLSLYLLFSTNNSYYNIYATSFNVTIDGKAMNINTEIPDLYNISFSLLGIPSTVSISMNFNTGEHDNIYTGHENRIETIDGKAFGYFPHGTFTMDINNGETAGNFSFNVSGTSENIMVMLYHIQFTVSGQYNNYLFSSIGGRINYETPNSFTYFMPNGTFSAVLRAYLYSTTVTYDGKITVNGQNKTVNFVFPSHYYKVNFTEIGLPGNQFWDINANYAKGNLSVSSRFGTSRGYGTLYLPNGTYTIQARSQYPYHTNMSILIVSGENESYSVVFNSSILFVFHESGLPSGTSWYMTIEGNKYQSNNGFIEFNLEAGENYSFSVHGPSNYISTPNAGILNLSYLSYLFTTGSTVNSYVYNMTIDFISILDQKYGYVDKTLIISNNSLLTGDYLAFNINNDPLESTFDPQNGLLYATYASGVFNSNPTSGIVIINPTTDKIEKIIPIANESFFYGIVYDPTNEHIYVQSSNAVNNSERLYELNTSTNMIKSAYAGNNIIGFRMVYVSSSNQLYMLSDNGITVINPDTLTVVKNITLGSQKYQNNVVFPNMVYSNISGDIYIAGFGQNITTIDPQTDEISGNISLGVTHSDSYYPETMTGSMVYDYRDNDLYLEVITLNSSKSTPTSYIYQISLTQKKVLGNFSVPDGIGLSMAFIPSINVLWVANIYTFPGNIMQFGYQGQTYEVNLSSNTVIQDLDTGYGSSFVLYVNTTDTLFVSNAFGGSISIIKENMTQISVYNVTFKESGLPVGTTWSVALNGNNQSSNTNSIIFSDPNGSYSFDVNSVPGYTASPSYGQLNVSGSALMVPITFTKNAVPRNYSVVFTETGLPLNDLWFVNLSDGLTMHSFSSVISYNLTNGTYGYTVSSSNMNYSAKSATGSFTVDGKNISISITFKLILCRATFTETGLSSGMQWNLSFMGNIYNLTNDSYSFLLRNGIYNYSVAQVHGFTLETPYSFTVSGSNVSITVEFIRNSTLHIHVNPGSALFTLNGKVYGLSKGYTNLSVTPGYYFVNASETGYYTFTNLFNFASKSYSINITLKSLIVYGQIKGTVYPGNAIISANGILIAVSNGTFEQDLSPGIYIVSATAKGYISSDYEINITQNQVSFLNISLTRSLNSYTIQGYVNPVNSSVMFGSYMAYVNSTGYFEISLPSGNYSISVTANGYFPVTGTISLKSNLILYFNLTKEPTPTSVSSSSNITASGYNVTVSNITYGNNNLSLKYNASANGTISVILPYSEVKNVSISDIMNSTVYVNGVAYKNFTIALSASNGTFSAILTVYGLNGDPVLIWAYSPAFVLHKPKNTNGFNILYFEIGAILGIIIIVAGSVAYIRRKKR